MHGNSFKVGLPSGVSVAELDRRLRQEGLLVGGSYGDLTNRVVRFGHMGTQAQVPYVQEGLAIFESVLRRLIAEQIYSN